MPSALHIICGCFINVAVWINLGLCRAHFFGGGNAESSDVRGRYEAHAARVVDGEKSIVEVLSASAKVNVGREAQLFTVPGTIKENGVAAAVLKRLFCGRSSMRRPSVPTTIDNIYRLT